MNRYRLKFSKTGRIRFIGHLDLLKVLQRAIVRADLPIKYSEGFNPHQKTAFALPLSLGMESLSEYVDIDLNEHLETEDFLWRINSVMPEGIVFHNCRELASDEKTAAALVEAARYEAVYSGFENLAEAVAYVQDASELITAKKTKKGTAETDIKKDIIELSLTENTVDMILAAGSMGGLKPELVSEVMFRFAKVSQAEASYRRIDLLKRENGELIGL